jgi:cupin fold WbuC family metalloprotein
MQENLGIVGFPVHTSLTLLSVGHGFLSFLFKLLLHLESSMGIPSQPTTSRREPGQQLRWIAPEVAYSDGRFLAAGSAIVSVLREAATRSPRRRCRLCFHAGPESAQQEMLIVMHRDSYVRPHRHFGKVETLMVVEGEADALIFDESGRLDEQITMSSPGAQGDFFYRMPERIFHTLRFRSEWFVFVETTIGPFRPSNSEGAPWAPPESEPEAGRAYLSGLGSVV